MIEEIEIIRPPAVPPITLDHFMGFTVNDPLYNLGDPHPGYFGTILITTKTGSGGNISGNKRFTISPLGYQVSKSFYSPAYETTEQQNETTPDLRSTIYWNPDVRANDDGEAEINFYAADPETSYTVTIQGMTNEGALIRKTEKIKREEN